MDDTEKLGNLYKYHKRETYTDKNINFFEENPIYYEDPSGSSSAASISSSGKVVFKNEIYTDNIPQLNPFIVSPDDYVCLFQIYEGSSWIDYVRPFEHLFNSPLANSAAYSGGTSIAALRTIGSEWTSDSGAAAVNWQWRFNYDAIKEALDIEDIADANLDFAEYKDAFEKKYLGGVLLSKSDISVVKILNLKLYYVEETAKDTAAGSTVRDIKFYHPILKKCIPSNFGSFQDDKKTYTTINANFWQRTGSGTDKSVPGYYDRQSGHLLTWKDWTTVASESDLRTWTSREYWDIHDESGILSFNDYDSYVDVGNVSDNRVQTPWITFFRYQGKIGVAPDDGIFNKDVSINGTLTVSSSIQCTGGYSLITEAGAPPGSAAEVFNTHTIIINPSEFNSGTALVNLPVGYKLISYKIFSSSFTNVIINKVYLDPATNNQEIVNSTNSYADVAGTWSNTEWTTTPFYLQIVATATDITGASLVIRTI